MNFRQKIEMLVGKTTDYEFSRACGASTSYIKENYIDGSLREIHVIKIVAGFVKQFREIL